MIKQLKNMLSTHNAMLAKPMDISTRLLFYTLGFFLVFLPHLMTLALRPDYSKIDGFDVFTFILYTMITCSVSYSYFKNHYNNFTINPTGDKQKIIYALLTFPQQLLLGISTFTIFYFYGDAFASTAIKEAMTNNNLFNELLNEFSGYQTYLSLNLATSQIFALIFIIAVLTCSAETMAGLIFGIFVLSVNITDHTLFLLMGRLFETIIEYFSHSLLTMTLPLLAVLTMTAIHIFIVKTNAANNKNVNIEKDENNENKK